MASNALAAFVATALGEIGSGADENEPFYAEPPAPPMAPPMAPPPLPCMYLMPVGAQACPVDDRLTREECEAERANPTLAYPGAPLPFSSPMFVTNNNAQQSTGCQYSTFSGFIYCTKIDL